MVIIFIKGIANGHLDHLPVFQKILRADGDGSELLRFDVHLLFLMVGVDSLLVLFLFDLPELLRGSSASVHVVELLKLLVFFIRAQLGDVYVFSLGVLRLFLLLAVEKHLRDREIVLGYFLKVNYIRLEKTFFFFFFLFGVGLLFRSLSEGGLVLLQLFEAVGEGSEADCH